MKRFSHIICFMLASVIALTAQSAALARTMPDASGQMVLCTGSGPMLVLFDENGKPVEAPQVCPECVLSLLHALGTDLAYAAATGVWRELFGPSFVIFETNLRLGAPKARGPPVSV